MRRAIALSITLFSVAFLAAPLAADAQEAGKVYRIAIVFAGTPVAAMTAAKHPYLRVFLETLRQRGYVEGQNLVIERRSAEGRHERYPEIAADLARLRPDVIVTTTPAVRLFTAAAPTIPILAFLGDPVGDGFAESLAHPGGNVSGVTSSAGPEIVGKRLELLSQVLPGISRVAYVLHRSALPEPALQEAAKRLGLTIVPIRLDAFTESQYVEAYSTMARERVQAFQEAGGPEHYRHRQLIADLVARHRLPGMHYHAATVRAGGLMAYALDFADPFRRLAEYVARILQGEPPGVLPIQRPTAFNLVINLKTAKALGLTIPPSVLVRADEVIE